MTVYNTRNSYSFYSWPVRKIFHGAETLSHLEPKICEIVQNNMNILWTFTAFKNTIK